MTLVRAERPEDRASVRRVIVEAFGRSEEADLVDALRASDAWVPGLSLVAEEDGGVVGHVLFTRARVRSGTDDDAVLALAPLAVRPDRQRRGIGDALVRAGVAAARARGDRAVVLVGHPAYYPRFGFVPAVPLGLSCVFAEGEHAPALQVLTLRDETPAGRVLFAPEFGVFE